MTHHRTSRDRGFTLVEMVITMAIVSVVMFGVFRVFTSTQRTYERGTENIDGQQNARAALSWMAKELRGAKGFNRVNPSEVTILSDKSVQNQLRTLRLDTNDRDNDGDTTELLLIRTPDDDGTTGIHTDEIAVGIDSLAFVYRDGNGNTTSARAAVQEVEIQLFATGSGLRDAATHRKHQVRQVGMSTRVKCRNLGMSVPTLGDLTPPAQPTGISVVMGCGTGTVQWNANSETDIAGYYVAYNQGASGPPYSGTDADQGASDIFVGNVTTYTLTGLSLGSTYYFSVQAVDAGDNVSPYGSDASGVPSDGTSPSTPTGLTGRVVGNDEIQLDWNAVSDWDVDWYKVYWYDQATPSTVNVDSTQATSSVLSGLTQDATYTFSVSARDACGNESATSNPVSITMVACKNDTNFPAVPASANSTPGDEFVLLSWSSVSDPDVVGYKIYFQQQGSSYGSTVTVGNVTQYSLYGLTNGVTYELQVAAVDGCGNVGGYTGLVSATPQNCAGTSTPPEKPANLTAQDLGVGDQVRLSWTVAGQGNVMGYIVHWGTSPTSLTNSVDVGNSIFYTVSGLVAGTQYWFAAESYDVCGLYSGLSPTVTATPTWGCACPPVVSVTNPAPSSVVQGVVSWTTTAQACSTSSISSVEFQVDGSTSYVDYSPPYEYGDFGSGWDTAFESDGSHQLVCLATDNNGCQSGDTLTVFVNNQGYGVSCIGPTAGDVAALSGAYDEQFTIGVTNQSSVDTYYGTSMVLEWDDPNLVVTSVSFDGSQYWFGGSGGGAASGDTLSFSQTLTVFSSDEVQMDVVTWESGGAGPPPSIDVVNTSFDATFFGSPVAVCGSYPIPMQACLPGVTIQSVNSSNTYEVWGPPVVGDVYYTDRTYTLTYLPPELDGSVLVRVPNDDKNLGDAHNLVLDFDRDVTVWIAYDPRGTPPNWIDNNYTDTGLTIGVTDSGTSTLGLWKKDVSQGTRNFSGNKAQGWGGGVGTNYVIFATCQ